MRYTTQFPDGGGINLTKAMRVAKIRKTTPPSEWKVHTQWHWSQMIDGHKLDFWPTQDKFMYQGKVYFGDVDEFIAFKSKGASQ